MRWRVPILITFGGAVLLLGYGALDDPAGACRETGPACDTHPVILPAYAILFETRVTWTFPIGSSETRLKNWLGTEGFTGERSRMDTMFADEPDELARIARRVSENSMVNVASEGFRSPCGRWIYSIGWNADASGRITEIYADTEVCHFDMP